MVLLIDYLETAATYLREKRDRLKKLDEQYRRIYDRDIKKEIAQIRQEIAKKTSEINIQLLLNLEEFRALQKYYPDLLEAYMEDEHIGKIISKKSWLLDFKQTPPQQAAAKLEQIKEWRAQLRDAKQFIRRWVGKVDARSVVSTYPILKGYMSGELDRDEVTKIIDNVDKFLIKEGWLLLICDSLIQIPLAKYMTKLAKLRYTEMQAQAELKRSIGRGTVSELTALKSAKKIAREREHYENMITQILLANPAYLHSLKKKKNWLSRERSGNMDRFVANITPHTIKERIWLNEMRKKLDG